MTDDNPQDVPPRSLSALILCAGRSSRMGALKPLLPMGKETLVERAIGLFRGAGITDVTVVVGHRADELALVVERLGVRLAVNDRYDEGMFSSVKVGAANLDRKQRAFFLLPVDIPLVKPETLRALMAAFREGEIDVCRPTFGGRRGHPPLISSRLIPRILDFDEPGGLRALLADQGVRAADVAVDDPGILLDLDTRGDYETALKVLADKQSG